MTPLINPKVSVIIPVYKAEQYIERCAKSLFEQTLDSIEYIFIDDCTPDKSISLLKNILNEYPQRINQVKIIKMPVNSKQAAARKAGMIEANGEFMIHCDPDDWVELNAYEKLYERAKVTNADVVTCRYYIHDNGGIRENGEIYSGSARDLLYSGLYESNIWAKLIKADIIKKNNIYPFDKINCGEDLNIVVRVLYHSNRIEGLKDCLYHYYQQNENSITKSDRLYLIEKYSIKNIQKIEEYFKQFNLNSDKFLNLLKLRLKNSLIWPYRNEDKRLIKQWCGLWPESHIALKYYPNLNKFQRIYISLFSSYPWMLKNYFNYIDWRSKR